MLPVVLHRGTESTLPIYALLDSGADKTLMPSDLAVSLGVADFKNGKLEPTTGVGQQRVDVFYHGDIEVELVGDGRRLSIEIGFIETLPTRRILPLLGRTFFSQFKSITFEERNELMELKI